MRVLVTGGCGFIGSHVVDLLARKGNHIQILDDLSTGNMRWINDLIQHKTRVHFDLCDIRRGEDVRNAFMAFQPEIVCHLAAQSAISTSWKNPILNAEVNEIGTLNLIDSAREFGVRRIIFASTSAVYQEDSPRNPFTPYGISKLTAERYLHALIANSVILRLGNVYGPRQMPIGKNQVIPLMLLHFLEGDDFTITGDGLQKRDFIYVGDVAEAFLLGMYGKPGTYNIASGKQTSVNDLAETLAEIYGVKGYPWLHSKEQDSRREVVMDISQANDCMGWKPSHALKDGLSLTAEWWNNRAK